LAGAKREGRTEKRTLSQETDGFSILQECAAEPVFVTRPGGGEAPQDNLYLPRERERRNNEESPNWLPRNCPRICFNSDVLCKFQ
jgi:hypothetical protein